jgi:hypothetical protein
VEQRQTRHKTWYGRTVNSPKNLHPNQARQTRLQKHGMGEKCIGRF